MLPAPLNWRWYCQHYVDFSRNSVNPLSPQGFITFMTSPKVAEMCRTFMAQGELLKECEELRRQSKADRSFLKHPVKIPTDLSILWATRYVFWEAMCLFTRDNFKLSKPNHWRDFIHMVVPVSYCDFVFVDGAWTDMARKVIRRISNSDQPIKMAKVFSTRELDNFWLAFDV
jgi:hypothetical protein